MKALSIKKKVILIILFLIIIFILFFNSFKTTGFLITDSLGILNVTILSSVSINFTVDVIDFGVGNIDAGANNATIDTLGNVINGNWTPVTNGFEVANLGNQNILLNLKTGKNAIEFIGGTNPAYQFRVSNLELGSCMPGVTPEEWNDVNTTEPGTLICSVFRSSISNNTVRIDLNLVIPSDSFIGFQNDVFTATGTAL